MRVKAYILMFCQGILITLFVNGQTPKDTTLIHIVQKGETFTSIATQYGISVSQLKQANIGKKHNVGARYAIPKTNYPPTSPIDSLKITINDGHANAESFEVSVKTHTVKQGENLQAIANKYKISIQSLMRWNSFKSKNLVVGQKIIVSGANNIYPNEQWNKNNRLSTPPEPAYQTSNKKQFNQYEEIGFVHLTSEVVHPTLPIGTMVLVTNLESKTQVLVRVTTNSELQNHSIIGLTTAVFSRLQFTNEYYVHIQYYLQ